MIDTNIRMICVHFESHQIREVDFAIWNGDREIVELLSRTGAIPAAGE